VDGDYWLKRQTQGRGHWARVYVRVEPATTREVLVAPDAGLWHERHGGRLSWASVITNEVREAAVTGARFALDEAGVDVDVTVLGIQEAPVDTAPEDVAFSTAWAVWSALGHTRSRPPTITEEGVLFPGPNHGGTGIK
jgi:hypothetical protein